MATNEKLKQLSFNGAGLKKFCIDLILQDRGIPIPTIANMAAAASARMSPYLLNRYPFWGADIFEGWEYGN